MIDIIYYAIGIIIGVLVTIGAVLGTLSGWLATTIVIIVGLAIYRHDLFFGDESW